VKDDASRLERSIELYRGLVKVSAMINSIPDLDGLLASILEIAREVLGAEANTVFLTTPNGDLELAIARGMDGQTVRKSIVVPRGQGIAGWVAEHGAPLLVPDAYADPRFYQEADRQTGFKTRSIICVPLRTGEGSVGALQALNPMGREAFDALDLEAFEAFAVLVASAIERLRFVERQIERERVVRELSLAREIQSSFLPPALPDVPGFSSAVRYRPARNIGGDFYDLVLGEKGQLHFAIGDVSGKGIPAALLMAQSLSAFRFAVKPAAAPSEVLRAWNTAMVGRTIRGMFVTALVGRLDLGTGAVEIASAGHCHPVCIGPGGAADEWELEPALPLGIRDRVDYRGASFSLSPDSWLALFTDGLTESFDLAGNILGVEGVRRLMAGPFVSADEAVSTVSVGERSYRGDREPHDDFTLLVLGRPASIRQPHAVIEFESQAGVMAGVRAELRRFLDAAAVPPAKAGALVLGADEACTNIIRHAYGGAAQGAIRIAADRSGDRLSIRIRDFGKTPPPEAFAPRPLDPTTPGGFGLHFIRAAFDRVEPLPRDPGTELILETDIPGDDEPA
jgi:sigma-B regulation protein RsbU (phosphoserine phosphatase)